MLARIVDGAIAEQRNLALEDVPAHKRHVWRPIEGDAPAYDQRTHTISGPTYQIEAERVLRVWQVTARDLGAVKADFRARVMAEFERRGSGHITPGAVKAQEYARKREEAASLLDQLAANPAAIFAREDYRLLWSMVGFDVPSAADGSEGAVSKALVAAAQLVETRVRALAEISEALAITRNTALAAIAAATTVEQVAAAYDTVAWP